MVVLVESFVFRNARYCGVHLVWLHERKDVDRTEFIGPKHFARCLRPCERSGGRKVIGV